MRPGPAALHPQFGPATGFSDGGGKFTGNVPVYLIFADPNGTATFGPDPTHPLAISDITQAVATILNSGYLSGLSQYGAASQAYLAPKQACSPTKLPESPEKQGFSRFLAFT
jgi:hypothetical protein